MPLVAWAGTLRRAVPLRGAVRSGGAGLGLRGTANAIVPEGARMALVWRRDVGGVAEGAGFARQ